MKLNLTGKNIEITEGIRTFIEKKTEKLKKFFDDSTVCNVTISIEKNIQHVDIRIEHKGKTYIANEATQDLYMGLENIIEKIEGQARKAKTINEKKRREGLSEKVVENDILDEEE